MRRQEGQYYTFYVEDIPALGYKTFVFENKEAKHKNPDNEFENAFYKITIDKENGGLSQIYDKKLKKNLIDIQDSVRFAQFIYEELDNRHEMERLTSTNRDTVYKPLGMKRSGLSNIEFHKPKYGPIYTTVSYTGYNDACADERGVTTEIQVIQS